uniref:MSP domain-containing protein n=1 Tax=Kalanchoe fedtschenkoi TaxID=63787 RepID=A0A7N0RCY0_KALFE
MGGGGGGQLVSVNPEDLRFHVELDRQSYCDFKITNLSENYVAFKVKTTTPKKYFVRPNTGIIRPLDSCVIRVTLQAQKEFPPDMQCKDKFLLQSTVVPPNTELEELSPDTFNKDGGKVLEECKLKVVYISADATNANSADEGSGTSNSKQIPEGEAAVQRLINERDAAVRQTHQMQQELELLRKRRNRRNDSGFSLKFALLVGLIGLIIGFLLNITSSSGKDEI